MPTTELGRDAALAALKERRENRPEKVDNAMLPAGSPMYFYCRSCGHPSDQLPESYTRTPSHTCEECNALIELGWMI